MAATVKGHITRFVNEDNNVTNAKEMEKAILSHGGLPGIRVAVLDCLGGTEVTGPQQKIPGISKLNNFRFSPGGVKVWQAFGIGPLKHSESYIVKNLSIHNKAVGRLFSYII